MHIDEMDIYPVELGKERYAKSVGKPSAEDKVPVGRALSSESRGRGQAWKETWVQTGQAEKSVVFMTDLGSLPKLSPQSLV